MSVILITGGNRGIGRETARQLDSKGHNVIVGTRSLENVIPISKRIISKQLDVTSQESIDNIANSINIEFGKIDVLINNAGISELRDTESLSLLRRIKNNLEENSGMLRKVNKKIVPHLKTKGIVKSKGGILNVPESDVKFIMETNFYGALRVSQAFSPLLENGINPQIINVSSGLGLYANLNPEYPAYSLSKSTLNALTIMLSKELAEKNIRVNAVCPGWVKTDMGGVNAPLSVEEGADTIVWLANNEITESGKFFKERKIVDW